MISKNRHQMKIYDHNDDDNGENHDDDDDLYDVDFDENDDDQ